MLARDITKTRCIAMKRIPLFLSFAAALMLTGASSAFAQSDIYRDLRDIKHDRVDIYRDRVDLAEDRVARNYDARREWRAIEHGNWRAAWYWNSRRRHEQFEVNADRHELRHDASDLARDRADLRRDIWRYTR
jgi:hypothetical protein